MDIGVRRIKERSHVRELFTEGKYGVRKLKRYYVGG